MDVLHVIPGSGDAGEKMYIHGFPRSIRAEGISDEALHGLAGNTVTVPLLGMIWMATLGHVDFTRPHGHLPQPGLHNVSKIGEAIQIHGPHANMAIKLTATASHCC